MKSRSKATPHVGAALFLVVVVLAWCAPALGAQLTLTWVDASTNELGFSIERSVGNEGAFVEIDTTGAGTTTYTDLSVSAGATYCYRVRAFSPAAYSDYSNPACASTGQVFGLAVVKVGAGSGTVISTPAGIICGASCSGSFAGGTAVTLTATAATGSTFTGWSGGGCSGTGACVATLSAATAVTATFGVQPAPAYTLTVSMAGTGSGTVTSAPAGINCGTTCAGSYTSGTAVTLTATAAAGSTFTGWSGGGCSGTSACVVSMSGATTVTATFASATSGAQLSLTWVDNATGEAGFSVERSTGTTGAVFAIVATTGPGVTSYNDVTVAPATSYCYRVRSFNASGYSPYSNLACGTSSGGPTPPTYALTVEKAGTGSGTVTSAPAGISCGTTCTGSYASGTAVTLTAAAATGSTFTGWSGGGCSGAGTCTVGLTAAATVTATFAPAKLVTLNVSIAGSLQGMVTSSPSGISCGSSGSLCSVGYPGGTVVTLTATPTNPGYAFAGWTGGGCKGKGVCTVTLKSSTSVTATFKKAPK